MTRKAESDRIDIYTRITDRIVEGSRTGRASLDETMERREHP